jgi:nucleoid-associated protein YgaU
MLTEKYKSLFDSAKQLQLTLTEIKEEGGKVRVKGNAAYQLDKDLFWDKVKTFSNWENEMAADIRVERTDIFGVYTVKSGDTLSKLAKDWLGDAKRYMEIFNINKDQLTNPDLIKVGQKLKLPKP